MKALILAVLLSFAAKAGPILVSGSGELTYGDDSSVWTFSVGPASCSEVFPNDQCLSSMGVLIDGDWFESGNFSVDFSPEDGWQTMVITGYQNYTEVATESFETFGESTTACQNLGGCVETFSFLAIPEPATWLLVLTGLGIAAFRGRREI